MRPERIGRYQIVEEVGLGAMGSVYKAFDPLIKRHLAIKTIRVDLEVGTDEYNGFLERFHQEARIAGTLNHPNIITIYDIGEEQGMPFLAFEFIEGEPLSRIIESKKPFSVPDVILIISQIANALDYAHSRSIVHRDVKPGNVLLSSGVKVKVLDFGISKFAESEITRPGMRLGSPGYMSPEQALGEPVDHRSDLFSLAAIAFELLTGQPPFQGESATAVLYNIVHGEPLRVENLEARGLLEIRWQGVFQRALAKDRERRFQKGEDFVRALWDCQKSAPQTYDAFMQSSVDVKRVVAPAAPPTPPPIPDKTVVAPHPVPPAPPPPPVAPPPLPSVASPPPVPVAAVPAASSEEPPATVILPQQHPGAAPSREGIPAADERTRVAQRIVPPPPLPTPPPPPIEVTRAAKKPVEPPPQPPVAELPPRPPLQAAAAVPAVAPPPVGERLPVAPPPPPPVRPKKTAPTHTRGFFLAVAALLLLMLVGAGYYLFVYKGQSQVVEPVPVTPLPQTQPASETLPPPPPPVPTVAVDLRTKPAGATVLFDGEVKGVTPVTLDAVPVGSHTVRFELKGYDPVDHNVDIPAEAKEAQVVDVALKPMTDMTVGSLKITSNPPGATILLDGKGLGVTPRTVTKLRAGKHSLELSLQGYYPWTGEPVVRAGRMVDVAAGLQEIPPPPPPPPPPPKEEPRPKGPLEVTPDIKFDRRPISGNQPEAPKIKTGRPAGSVLVKIVVGVAGNVQSVDIQQSGGDLLDGAVLRAVRNWKFKPATKDGAPVEVYFLYRFTFK